MKESLTKKDATIRLMKYCAYRERCHKEVRSKLLDLGMRGDDLEDIISKLINENFLNEQRFAEAFARGKFKINRWGRHKIRNELRKRNVSAYCIKKGMMEISETDYEETIEKLIDAKKRAGVKEKSKIAKYLFQKGYENQKIWEMLKRDS